MQILLNYRVDDFSDSIKDLIQKCCKLSSKLDPAYRK